MNTEPVYTIKLNQRLFEALHQFLETTNLKGSDVPLFVEILRACREAHDEVANGKQAQPEVRQ
jgi:hypothetical protein